MIRWKKDRSLWVAFGLLIGTLLLTIVAVITSGGNSAYASTPGQVASNSCQYDGSTPSSTSCNPGTVTSTQMVFAECTGNSSGVLPTITITSGTGSLVTITDNAPSVGYLGQILVYEYGAAPTQFNCASGTGGASVVMSITVWQNLTPSLIDTNIGFSTNAAASTSWGFGFEANGSQELSIGFWGFNTSQSVTSSPGDTVALSTSTSNPGNAVTWGAASSALGGGFFVGSMLIVGGSNWSAVDGIVVTFKVTITGATPIPTSTTAAPTTTVPGATTTTDCPTVNGNEYCSGYSPTTISGESCAWDIEINGYICPTFTPTTTTTIPTTTTTECQTLYNGTTPVTFCSGVAPTSIDGQSCAWDTAIQEYTCQDSATKTCSFYDIICELELLFEPSPAAVASMNTALGDSGINTVESGLSSIGTDIYNFASDGDSYSGGLYGGGTSNDYCLAFENGDPYAQYEGAGPPAILNDGALDLTGNLGGATATGGVSQYSGDSNVSPGNLCYWQGQMNTVITHVPDWPYLKDIVETGLVIMTIIGALRIIISAFQSGK